MKSRSAWPRQPHLTQRSSRGRHESRGNHSHPRGLGDSGTTRSLRKVRTSGETRRRRRKAQSLPVVRWLGMRPTSWHPSHSHAQPPTWPKLASDRSPCGCGGRPPMGGGSVGGERAMPADIRAARFPRLAALPPLPSLPSRTVPSRSGAASDRWPRRPWWGAETGVDLARRAVMAHQSGGVERRPHVSQPRHPLYSRTTWPGTHRHRRRSGATFWYRDYRTDASPQPVAKVRRTRPVMGLGPKEVDLRGTRSPPAAMASTSSTASGFRITAVPPVSRASCRAAFGS